MKPKLKVTEMPVSSWKMLPPPADICQICATKHNPEEPHNQQSVFYQVGFKIEHDRFPTWADAMAHCSPETKKLWTEELAKMGVIVGLNV